MTEKELKQEYYNTVQAITDPAEHDRAYKEFLVSLYRLNGSPRIFHYLQMEPFQNGIYILFDYILKSVSITPSRAYQRLIDECIGKYVANLVEFGLVDESETADLESLYEELIYSCLKGADTLGKKLKKMYCGLPGMTPEEKLELKEQDRVAYTVWYNIVQKLHDRFLLPPVKKVTSCFLNQIEPIGHQVIDSGDFSEFQVTEEEKIHYRQLCKREEKLVTRGGKNANPNLPR